MVTICGVWKAARFPGMLVLAQRQSGRVQRAGLQGWAGSPAASERKQAKGSSAEWNDTIVVLLAGCLLSSVAREVALLLTSYDDVMGA